MQRESLGMYSSRVCVENRCVSTPARKGHVESRATRRKVFFCIFCYLRVLQPARFGYTGANGNIPLPGASNLPVRRQQQQPTSNQHWRIRLISPHPNEANEQIRRIIWGEGNVRAARPTKHTKFKTNKLTSQLS